MIAIHPKYVVDEKNERSAVVLPVAEWNDVLAELEELDDIRAYDAAKAGSQEAIPFEQAMKEVNTGRI